LLVGLLVLGANIRKFPLDGINTLASLGFIATIGGILSLLALYWLRLNMFQTLGYLASLSLPALFFGNRALSYLYTINRAEKTKKE